MAIMAEEENKILPVQTNLAPGVGGTAAGALWGSNRVARSAGKITRDAEKLAKNGAKTAL